MELAAVILFIIVDRILYLLSDVATEDVVEQSYRYGKRDSIIVVLSLVVTVRKQVFRL